MQKLLKNRYVKIAGIVAAAILVLAIGSGIILSMNPSYVVMKAISNTCGETSKLDKKLGLNHALNILETGKYTVQTRMESGGETVVLQYANQKKSKELSGSYENLAFDLVLDQKDLRMKLGDNTNRVLVYDYHTTGSGAMRDLVGSQNLRTFNSYLQMLQSGNKADKVERKIYKALKKNYLALRFNKTTKEWININGKDCNCTGYFTKLEQNTLLDLAKDLEQVAKEEGMDATAVSKFSLQGMIDVLNLMAEDWKTTQICFYIRGSKLAGVYIGNSEAEYQLQFHGGGKRMENWSMKVIENGTENSIASTTTQNGDIYQVIWTENQKDPIASFTYDEKKGEYQFEQQSDYLVKGTIQNDAKQVCYTMDYIYESGQLSSDKLSLSVTKGAKIQSLQGSENDLLDMNVQQLEQMLQEIQSDLSVGL